MTNDYDDLCKRLRDPNASRVYGLAGSRTCNEAADAIAALRAENDHLLRCVKAADDVTSASAMELMRERAEKAEADNAALRKDAERYRWLRDNCQYQEGISPVLRSNRPLELDSAIDAMLAGKKP